jgi:hypothetical protein
MRTVRPEDIMNKPLLILVTITALLTAACASQATKPAPAQVARLSPSQQYQNYVMEHAKAVHAEVHWYNVPDDDDVSKFDFSKK